jgi:hypothetical protein
MDICWQEALAGFMPSRDRKGAEFQASFNVSAMNRAIGSPCSSTTYRRAS